MGGWKSCLLAAAHLVGADGGGDDEGVVLLFRYLDAVRVADAEPARRHLGHSVAVPFDLVLVVDDVALGLEVVTALDVDRVAVAKGADERLLDRRNRFTVLLDFHRLAHANLLALDR